MDRQPHAHVNTSGIEREAFDRVSQAHPLVGAFGKPPDQGHTQRDGAPSAGATSMARRIRYSHAPERICS